MPPNVVIQTHDDDFPDPRRLVQHRFDAGQRDIVAADHPEIVRAARTPLVVTPHAGEFARLAGKTELRDYAAETGATVVLKGPVTRIASGQTVYHNFFGGPVLARGGSGDLLAGLIGSQLAQTPADLLGAACRGVAWHGCAADALARSQGATAVRTTQVLDYLSTALRPCGE